MPNPGDVVLITGPMGSGKSTLACALAKQLGWEAVSEDTYWVEAGWGSGLRSPEQEQAVQRRVVDHLLTVCRSGRSVVLEFVVYNEPPNPLTAYQQALADNAVDCQVIVLKPSIPEILRRIAARGRPGDLQRLPARRHAVEHQVLVLESDAMQHYRVIDTTDLSAEEASRICLESLGSLPRVRGSQSGGR